MNTNLHNMQPVPVSPPEFNNSPNMVVVIENNVQKVPLAWTVQLTQDIMTELMSSTFKDLPADLKIQFQVHEKQIALMIFNRSYDIIRRALTTEVKVAGPGIIVQPGMENG